MAEKEVAITERPQREARKCSMLSNILLKEERKAQLKEITGILKKAESDRSEKENIQLMVAHDIVKLIEKRAKLQKIRKDRLLEIEDAPDVLDIKCKQLAEEIKASKNIVVYTGAGISTAASIPDYRGPNGVWTLLKKGQELRPQDLSDAEPTFTHMSITKLQKEGHIKHVVSQNCDGLHVRSGFPRHSLSEVHGNMYIENCYNCKPKLKQYIRLFDVTERTGMRRHATGRSCLVCEGPLKDTIVHFGEKGGLKSPYNWKKAATAANNADVILCLGTSLKVLKKYSCLWGMDKRRAKRPKLYIVNLQWTPKDDSAVCKISGRCDDVMEKVMKHLNMSVPSYKRSSDPIFRLATPLSSDELESTKRKILQVPEKPRRHQHNKKPNIGSIIPKMKSLSKHGSIRAMLESPVKLQNCERVFSHEDLIDKSLGWVDGKPKHVPEISLEVREKLSEMLRNHKSVSSSSSPLVFPNQIHLPVSMFPSPLLISSDSTSSNTSYHLSLPSTSQQNSTSSMHALTSNIYSPGYEYNGTNTETLKPNIAPSSYINSLNVTVPLDLKTLCRNQINFRLDHNYVKDVRMKISPLKKLIKKECSSSSILENNKKRKLSEIHESMNMFEVQRLLNFESMNLPDNLDIRETQITSKNQSQIKEESGLHENVSQSQEKNISLSQIEDSSQTEVKNENKVQVKEEREANKRRKSSSSLPGWFGKGLNVKRKRR